MARAFDGTVVDDYITLPCGSEAYFDEDSGISYRCMTCMAVWQSIATPRDCIAIAEADELIKDELKRLKKDI
jgi:hypothetical protein